MSEQLRNLVWATFTGDAEMNTLGINANTLYPALDADSPETERFMTLRWRDRAPRPGRDTTAAPHTLEVWAYDRSGGYAQILKMLRRAGQLLQGLEGARMPEGGAVIGVDDQGQSDDLRDDTYNAATRNASYRIVASEA